MKEKLQNVWVEMIGDCLMLTIALIGAYYIKVFVMG